MSLLALAEALGLYLGVLGVAVMLAPAYTDDYHALLADAMATIFLALSVALLYGIPWVLA